MGPDLGDGATRTGHCPTASRGRGSTIGSPRVGPRKHTTRHARSLATRSEVSGRKDIVRRAHDALNRGDAKALAALCAPDFRLDMSDRVFNPEVYSGHEGIRRFVADVHEVWETSPGSRPS